MLNAFFSWYDALPNSLPGAILLFAAGLLLLIKGGDRFVGSAVSVAQRFRVPEVIIGATAVSVGTTLPEVLVSATAAVNGNGAIAYGNAIGSIICNTALIAALTVAIRPGAIDRGAILTPVRFFFLSAAVYMVAAYGFRRFDRWLGFVMLGIFALYMTLTIRRGVQSPKDKQQEAAAGKLWFDLAVLVGSAGLIAIGADMLEGASVSLATMAGIPAEVVGVTVVALCTSLPELITAITALIKGHSALSLGNIIGANIFNLVLVSGVAVTVSPFAVPEGSTLWGQNTSLVLELPVMLAVMALLALPALRRGRLFRWQGAVLLSIYTIFVLLQVLIALRIL